MQPGKRFTPRHYQDFTAGIASDSHHGFVAETSHMADAMEAAAKAKPVKIDRGSSFLNGAADGENPTPDYDEAVDTMADFLVDGFHDYYEEERRAFDIGDDGFITVQIGNLSKAAQKLALNALDVWTFATGIEFKVVKGAAEIVMNDNYASAYTETEVDGNTITSAFINIADEWLGENGTGIYDYSMLTFIHELGHALGLGHGGIYGGFPPPVDPPEGLPNDSWQATIMSYYSQDENENIDADYAIPITPMMADLLAIQELYGTAALRIGKNVYSFEAGIKAGASLTVVDGGGLDRLDFSWSKTSNVIDLREEAFSSINGVAGNVGIARGTVIEAAVGGTKGDTIIGNDYANALYGNLGKDTLTGNDGEDFFVFDTKPAANNADVITDFVAGADSLVFNNAIYTAIGKDGGMKAGAFAINETGDAGDKSDRVIYDTLTGDVFYDTDGSKGGKAVLVANIGAGIELTAGDVWVI